MLNGAEDCFMTLCVLAACVCLPLLLYTPMYIVGSGDGAPEQWGPEAATQKTKAKVRKSGLHLVLARYTFSR